MAAAIGLREDFDGSALRGLAKRTRDASQMRHLLALAEIYDGGSRGAAARIGGVGRQTIRDWVLRFNAERPEGLVDGKAPGTRPWACIWPRSRLPSRKARMPSGLWIKLAGTARPSLRARQHHHRSVPAPLVRAQSG
jgi:Winged helix-turn helix